MVLEPPDETVAPVPPGVPLQVVGTSLPFAACAVIHPGGGQSGPIIVDLRNIRLAKINTEFIDSITSFQPEGSAGASDEEIPV